MSLVIRGQIFFVLATLCTGMFLMAGYDLLRLLRWIFPHGPLWVWAEDLLYWSAAALPVFCLFFTYNEGIIRWYGVLGLLAGALLYEMGISRPIRDFLGKYANKLRWKCGAPFRKWKKHRARKRQKPVMQSALKRSRIFTIVHKFVKRDCEKGGKGV